MFLKRCTLFFLTGMLLIPTTVKPYNVEDIFFGVLGTITLSGLGCYVWYCKKQSNTRKEIEKLLEKDKALIKLSNELVKNKKEVAYDTEKSKENFKQSASKLKEIVENV